MKTINLSPVILINIFLISLLVLSAAADKIILVEGREIICTIREINQTEVKIIADDVEITIPRARIKEIKREEAKPAETPLLSPTPSASPGISPFTAVTQATPTPAPEGLSLPTLTSVVGTKEPGALPPLTEVEAKPGEKLPALTSIITAPVPAVTPVPSPAVSPEAPFVTQPVSPFTTVPAQPPSQPVEPVKPEEQKITTPPPVASPMMLKPFQELSPEQKIEEKPVIQPPFIIEGTPEIRQISPTPAPQPQESIPGLKPFVESAAPTPALIVAEVPPPTSIQQEQVAPALTPILSTERLSAPAEEFRGVWISRFEWPDPDAATCKGRIQTMFDKLTAANINAVFFQVRGQGDVLYPSQIEPWSKLLGAKDPGFDPLQFALEEAHKRGLEFHAVVNICPVWQGTEPPPATEIVHPFIKYCSPTANPTWVCLNETKNPIIDGDKYYYFSSGIPQFHDYIRQVIVDIVRRYDVDGIHYDRVRYPHPNASHDPITLERLAGDGNPDQINKEDWQRQQLSMCLEKIYAEVMSIKPRVKITAAVWGIHRKDKIPGYSGFSSGYHDYYQDSIQWVEEGAVDALLPMIYWPMNDGRKPDYDDCIKYFVQYASKRHIYGLVNFNNIKQLQDAVNLNRTLGVPGTAFFSWTRLNAGNLLSEKKTTLFPQPASIPKMSWKETPATGIILGKVINSADNSPVMDALVTVASNGKKRLSSADGTFALLELSPGNHSLIVKKNGIGEKTIPVEVEAGKVVQVEVKL